MNALKMRRQLTALFFMQFAVWGAYLTSMGAYLASARLASHIGYFYSIQGLVSIFMPTFMGIIADRYVRAERLLGFCHLVSAALMAYVGYVGSSHSVSFVSLFIPYTLAVAFYMPTLSLSNSVAYSAMQTAAIDKIAVFPKIRIFGTVGFIVSMWTVDWLGFQTSSAQFYVCAFWGLLLGFYSFTMPACPVAGSNDNTSLSERLGLTAFRLFANPRMALFFAFSMLLGMSLQVTNGFANPFIQDFSLVSQYVSSPFVEHANMLISLSQLSETLCILLIPFFMKRYGIKTVMLTSMFAWVLRFALFGVGYPAWPGIVALVLSMIVYGVAFDFFNISGSLFVDSEVSPSYRSSAQGLFMLMTNGLGAGLGTIAAQAVVNHFAYSAPEGMPRIEGWHTAWLVFALFAAIVGILFALLFPAKKK